MIYVKEKNKKNTGYYGVAIGNDPMLVIFKHRTPKVCPFVLLLKIKIIMQAQTTNPFGIPDGVKFRTLIKSDITMCDGSTTSLFSIVPEGLSFDDTVMGIITGLTANHDVTQVNNEVYTLTKNKIEFFCNIKKNIRQS
jgi:hypothetical protein